MNARRSRNDSTQRLAEFRWWGCVLLAMFAVVQTARGSVGPTAPPEPIRSDSSQVPLASAASDPAAHVVTNNANIPVAAWRQVSRMPIQEIYGSKHLEIKWR
jgi:hypothetical protein